MNDNQIVSDSPYRHPLNTAVLKLQQSGLITELKKKWWTQKRGGGRCRVRKNKAYDQMCSTFECSFL